MVIVFFLIIYIFLVNLLLTAGRHTPNESPYDYRVNTYFYINHCSQSASLLCSWFSIILVIQVHEINLSVPYGLILGGLDHRGAAWHPAHVGHLEIEERRQIKGWWVWQQEVNTEWLYSFHSLSYTVRCTQRGIWHAWNYSFHKVMSTKTHAVILTRFLEILCLCSHFADSISHRHIQLSREPVHSFLPSIIHKETVHCPLQFKQF